MAAATDSDLRERRVWGYETARPDVQAHVPEDARRVLDLGCSSGALGAALKARGDAVVVGVELDPDYADAARRRLDRVVTSDVGTFLRGPAPEEAPFDCLIAADILEHLVDPWAALRDAASLVRPGGTVVVSLPNVLHWGGLLRLARGRRWPRDDSGPFDRTHLRWFARTDVVELLEQAGVDVVRVEPRYWTEGWRLKTYHALARTPLKDFLPVQHVASGVRRSAG